MGLLITRTFPNLVTLSIVCFRTSMGGPNAPLSPTESVTGLLSVLDRFQPAEQSGNFYDYAGQQQSW